MSQKLPGTRTLTMHAQAVGLKKQLLDLRSSYKLEGMSAREAAVRAYRELEIGDKLADMKRREAQAVILGRDVPLTPSEMKDVHPDYEQPSVTKGGKVGDAVLSLPEQVRWVKQQLARVRNGEGTPKEFPNADTLYWYQIAVTRPVDFDKIVLKIEAPEKESEDAWMRDGQYQLGQIESQIAEALRETGKQLVELEAGFSETLDGLLSAGAEGSGEQSLVPA